MFNHEFPTWYINVKGKKKKKNKEYHQTRSVLYNTWDRKDVVVNNKHSVIEKKISVQISIHRKKKRIYIREKNIVSRRHQQNSFYKNDRPTLKLFSTCQQEKTLFLGLENRNSLWYCDFLGRWEKLYHENEKCILFPDSWYVNWYPDVDQAGPGLGLELYQKKESMTGVFLCIFQKLKGQFFCKAALDIVPTYFWLFCITLIMITIEL